MNINEMTMPSLDEVWANVIAAEMARHVESYEWTIKLASSLPGKTTKVIACSKLHAVQILRERNGNIGKVSNQKAAA